MQLTGGQFTSTSALLGNDIATFPDFPAEIRAPRGTTYGVSGFQVQFASREIYTAGDSVNAMVAMNPAAFKTNITDVEAGGIVIVNEDEFTKTNFKKCGYDDGYDPLEDEHLNGTYHIVRVPMSRLTRESLADSEMGAKDVDRCRNMFALGLICWLYGRSLEPTVEYLETYFGGSKGRPEVAEINVKALKAGYYFGETAELFPVRYQVAPAKQTAGTYRQISGIEAMALGFVAASVKAKTGLLYAGYPITPASDLLHQLARMKHFGIRTFQAEDEIAAVSAAIGGAFAGDLALCGTSGPGMALKSEAMGLAVIYELPLVIVDVQRAGPATGMPTKTEQADLLMSMFGRPSEAPVIILAPRSPSDCFDISIEAIRLAVRAMCPVIVLADGSIANGAEPWKLPDFNAIEPIEVMHPTETNNPDGPYRPYERNAETLGRPWAIPGTPGLEHRVGGLEKQDGTGDVSYDPANHDHMVRLRAEKVARLADVIPPLEVNGPDRGTLLLGWGGTYGAITTAGIQLRDEGHQVATAHLRHLNPMPANLGEVLRRYERVIVPEINLGQLKMLIRDQFLVDAISLTRVRGQAFFVQELVDEVIEIMKGAAS
jgi:2-oxoglutarate ferredoxin oxidoreductase subunit alpha